MKMFIMCEDGNAINFDSVDVFEIGLDENRDTKEWAVWASIGTLLAKISQVKDHKDGERLIAAILVYYCKEINDCVFATFSVMAWRTGKAGPYSILKNAERITSQVDQ